MSYSWNCTVMLDFNLKFTCMLKGDQIDILKLFFPKLHLAVFSSTKLTTVSMCPNSSSCCSVAQSCFRHFLTPKMAACQASLSFSISQSMLKLMSVESVMPSSHLVLCCPLLLLSSVFPASGSFPVSQLFTSGSQIIGASSASVLPVNIQD